MRNLSKHGETTNRYSRHQCLSRNSLQHTAALPSEATTLRLRASTADILLAHHLHNRTPVHTAMEVEHPLNLNKICLLSFRLQDRTQHFSWYRPRSNRNSDHSSKRRNLLSRQTIRMRLRKDAFPLLADHKASRLRSSLQVTLILQLITASLSFNLINHLRARHKATITHHNLIKHRLATHHKETHHLRKHQARTHTNESPRLINNSSRLTNINRPQTHTHSFPLSSRASEDIRDNNLVTLHQRRQLHRVRLRLKGATYRTGLEERFQVRHPSAVAAVKTFTVK